MFLGSVIVNVGVYNCYYVIIARTIDVGSRARGTCVIRDKKKSNALSLHCINLMDFWQWLFLRFDSRVCLLLLLLLLYSIYMKKKLLQVVNNRAVREVFYFLILSGNARLFWRIFDTDTPLSLFFFVAQSVKWILLYTLFRILKKMYNNCRFYLKKRIEF